MNIGFRTYRSMSMCFEDEWDFGGIFDVNQPMSNIEGFPTAQLFERNLDLSRGFSQKVGACKTEGQMAARNRKERIDRQYTIHKCEAFDWTIIYSEGFDNWDYRSKWEEEIFSASDIFGDSDLSEGFSIGLTGSAKSAEEFGNGL